jgi:hypothetical protein
MELLIYFVVLWCRLNIPVIHCSIVHAHDGAHDPLTPLTAAKQQNSGATVGFEILTAVTMENLRR